MVLHPEHEPASGWPGLYTGRGEAIATGKASWRRFCAKATEEQIARTVAAIMAMLEDRR